MDDERIVTIAHTASAQLQKHARTLENFAHEREGNLLRKQSCAIVFDATVTTADDETPKPVTFRFFVEQMWEGTRKLVIQADHTTASFDSDHNIIRFDIATESLLRHFVRTFTPRIASMELLRVHV